MTNTWDKFHYFLFRFFLTGEELKESLMLQKKNALKNALALSKINELDCFREYDTLWQYITYMKPTLTYSESCIVL